MVILRTNLFARARNPTFGLSPPDSIPSVIIGRIDLALSDRFPFLLILARSHPRKNPEEQGRFVTGPDSAIILTF